ncbi:MAG: hypothetical protein AB7F86_12520 [Bdellovibrionales bacterium]
MGGVKTEINRSVLVIPLCLFLFGTVACSNKKKTNVISAASTGPEHLSVSPKSCDHRLDADPAKRQCRSWTGAIYDTADLPVSCSAFYSGTYFDGECSTAGDYIGTCILNEGQSYQVDLYYYASEYSISNAMDNCAARAGNSTTATWRLY